MSNLQKKKPHKSNLLGRKTPFVLPKARSTFYVCPVLVSLHSLYQSDGVASSFVPMALNKTEWA